MENVENKENFGLKVKKSLNNAYKKVISTFNNYRTTSIVMSVIALVAILASVGVLLAYEFAGNFDEEINMQITAFADKPIHGMVLFLSCIFVIIAGIVTIYVSFPAIVNKDVVQTKKSRLIASFVSCFFSLVIAVFIIILLTSKERIKTEVPFIISLVFGLLAAIANGLLFVPYFKCTFYMPPIKR